jgi:hypothetical protein
MWVLKRDPEAARCLTGSRWQSSCRGVRWLTAN